VTEQVDTDAQGHI